MSVRFEENPMQKAALAALTLALSFGIGHAVSAQDSSQSSQGQSSSSNQGSGSTTGSGGSSSSGNSGSGSGTVTTTTTPSAAQPTPSLQVQTYGKYASTTTTQTSTGAQKSTSTTSTTAATKTASIAKPGQTTTTTTSGKDAAATTPAAGAAKKPKDEIVMIQDSGDKKYVCTKPKTWQQFDGYISLKPGQEALPLTMTVTNVNYTGLNIFLNGQKLATDKDFKSNTLRMQMTGALAGGDNKFTVQAFGPTGANLTWKLTTLKPVITSIKPVTGGLEDDITLIGRNFAKVASANLVYVGQKAAVVKAAGSSSGKEIVFNLPKDTPTGKVNITVSIGGILSKPYEFTIKGAPEVTGVDLLSGPPGQSMVISGKGFSATASENVVTIGGVPAPVTSCTNKSITINIPEMYYPQWNLPVLVKTGGVESKAGVTVNVQSRVIPNEGVPEQ
jgi:hypothetical protein